MTEKEMVTILNQKRTCINKHDIIVESNFMCDYCDRLYNSKSKSCYRCIKYKKKQDSYRDENVKSINCLRSFRKCK